MTNEGLTKATRIFETAKEDSYKRGTSRSVRGYPNGHPKPEYKKDLNKAFPNRDGWRAQTKAGASCDVFVGVVVRASGADKHFPRCLDEMLEYVRDHPKKWKRIKNPKRKDLLPGDIIFQRWWTGNGHVSFYMGKNKDGDHIVANAHYYGKSYPVRQLYHNQVRPEKRCKHFYAFRIREDV